ncbi:ABC transporter permease [Micromonospora sp. NPDC000089]|uniref:ABC transporter permease n=1 Tax=unclassified Micromonospora TaxID=2617518 RepID=UPI0036A113D0
MSAVARQLRVLSLCWRAAVATELEYRVNFLATLAVSAFWMSWAVGGASIYFRFTGAIAGWSHAEVLVVIGLFFALNGLRQALLQPNLNQMTEYVRRGTLDFLLTKPFDAQLLVSLRQLKVSSLPDLLLGLVLAGVGVALSGRRPSVGALAAFGWLAAAALLLLYALTVLLMAFGVVTMAAEELGIVAFGLAELARFPVQLYRDPVQTLLTVLPVAFLTTYPAQALLGRLDPRLLLVAPAVAAVALLVARFAWRRSLRAYTGASA